MTRKPPIPRRRIRRHPLPLAMAAALASGLAQAAPPPDALPTGGNVVQGSVSITPLTSLDLLIQQTSNGGIINWNTFSIGEDASVTFQHSSASAVTLNRVITTVPSEIFGALTANGRVFIVNPNGVVFGGSAEVNVGGLVASTLGIGDADFSNGVATGQFRFGDVGQDFHDRVLVEAGANLRASAGGTIALLGGEVVNGGFIGATGGTVALASSREVVLDFFGDGLTQVSLAVLGSDDGFVANADSGVIQADGGRIELRARTYDGDVFPDPTVYAGGVLRARTLESREGRIVLDAGSGDVQIGAGGRIAAGATLDVMGTEAGQRGGSIEIRGDSVSVQGRSDSAGCEAAACVRLDASGVAGGGSIDIQARHQIVLFNDVQDSAFERGVQLRADATGNGDGGAVRLVSAGEERSTDGSPVAGGVLLVGGAELSAGSSGGRGGSIELDAGAGGGMLLNLARLVPSDFPPFAPRLDASGATGGGTVSVRAGTAVWLDQGASLHADATSAGNGGQIQVQGQTGLIANASMSARGGEDGGDGGEVRLGADGLVALGGDIDASAAAGRGGSVEISGGNLGLLGNLPLNPDAPPPPPRIEASGRDAGGSVLIQADGALAMEPGAMIAADATGNGDGGRVELLATDSGRLHGSISARGGASGGDGGFVETSAGAMDLRGLRVDAGAPAGAAGAWLIDPFNVSIVAGEASGSLPENPFDPVADTIIQDGDINAALNSGTSVTIGTGATDQGSPFAGYITIFSGVDINRSVGDQAIAFRLDANAGIQGSFFSIRSTSGGPMDIVFNADANGLNPDQGYIDLFFGELITNGGSISMFGQSDPDAGLAGGIDSGIALFGSTLDTRVGQSDDGEGGSVLLRGISYASDAGAFASGVRLEGANILTATGEVTIHGEGQGGAGVTLLAFSVTENSLIRTTLGDIRITGLASFVPDGNSPLPGIQVIDSLIQSAGGNIDLRGRAEGPAGATAGVVLSNAGVHSGGGALQISGQSVGDGVGIGILDGSEVDAGDGRLVLRAGNDGSAPAVVVDGSVTSASSVNLRAGSVGADGSIGDNSTQAIHLGGNSAFASIASIDNIDTPLLVVGHAGQGGAITVAEALQRNGSLTLHNASPAGIQLDAGVDVGQDTLTLVSGGDITQQGAIRAGSLLAGSGGGSVVLDDPANLVDGNTIAGEAAGDFSFVGTDTVTIGTVSGTSMDVTGAPITISVTGIAAGGSVFVRSLEGNIVQLANVSAGGLVDLVSAGVYLNGGGGVSAGDRWRIWADTWVDEERGGLAGSGPLPNLYNCSFGGPCGVTVSDTDNHFIYAQQPRAGIVIDSASREYGLDNPEFTFTLTGLILGDTFGNAISGAPVTLADILSNVGLYAIDGGFVSAAGYALDITPGTLEITPATLTFLADPFSRIYGDPNGVLTGTVTGFRNDDTVDSATSGALVWSTDATETSNVGLYGIFGGGLEAQNYVFVQADSNATALEITPATLTFVADPFSRIYGDPNGVLTGSVTGFRNDDTLGSATTGTLAWTTEADQTSNVGFYAILGGGLEAQNYVFVQADSNATALEITPATLTFLADPLTRFFGTPNPPLTGSVIGLRNGDTLAGATSGTLVWVSSADAGSLPGFYAILGEGLSAQNYVFEQAPENQTALHVLPLAPVGPDILREDPTTYLYDRNISPMLACPIAAPTDPLRTDQGSDGLAREWTRVRSRPNLTSCISSERRHGCSDF